MHSKLRAPNVCKHKCGPTRSSNTVASSDAINVSSLAATAEDRLLRIYNGQCFCRPVHFVSTPPFFFFEAESWHFASALVCVGPADLCQPSPPVSEDKRRETTRIVRSRRLPSQLNAREMRSRYAKRPDDPTSRAHRFSQR